MTVLVSSRGCTASRTAMSDFSGALAARLVCQLFFPAGLYSGGSFLLIAAFPFLVTASQVNNGLWETLGHPFSIMCQLKRKFAHLTCSCLTVWLGKSLLLLARTAELSWWLRASMKNPRKGAVIIYASLAQPPRYMSPTYHTYLGCWTSFSVKEEKSPTSSPKMPLSLHVRNMKQCLHSFSPKSLEAV